MRLSTHSQQILDDYLRSRMQQRRTPATPMVLAS
jgi:hypothetical protein